MAEGSSTPNARQVILWFWLNEEVTPELFAEKVALACAKGGAIREGEGVSYGDGLYRYLGSHEVELDMFDHPIFLPNITKESW